MVYGVHVHSVATKWAGGGFFRGAAAFPQHASPQAGQKPPLARFCGKERLMAQNLPLRRQARDNVNDPESAGLQRTKECREHGWGLPLGAADQHDAAASLLE